MKDSLGDRMKSSYEDRTRYLLPRRTNTIIRVDGKAFHTFTRSCKKPFDDELMLTMDETAKALCQNIQGAKLGYVQSDEISIWLTDYDAIMTDAWFDGNLQKMVSVAASIATAHFNKLWMLRNQKLWASNKECEYPTDYTPAMFDARAFTIPEVSEVANYFLWRSRDASRNSVQTLARSIFSHKQLEGKSTGDIKSMLKEGGVPWEMIESRYRNGRVVRRVNNINTLPDMPRVERSVWTIDGLLADTYPTWSDILEEISQGMLSESTTNESLADC